MLIGQIVHCPNCGGLAERQYFQSNVSESDPHASSADSIRSSSAANQVVMETRCRSCDYSLSQCLSSGAVLEFYAPGLREDLSEAQAAHCSI